MGRLPFALAALPILACSLAFPTREAADVSAADAGGAVAEAGGPGGPDGDAPVVGASIRSCKGLARSCGAGGDRDCCEVGAVPGGTFARGYDGATFPDAGFAATVSAFRLDVFEVTVGRFRSFVAGYARPAPGAGWEAAYDDLVPADGPAMEASLASSSCEGQRTWTPAPGANEALPIQCLRWHEADAFCLWDGGRLPTEAEWNLAAAGGAEQRVHPWGSAAADPTRAVFGAPAPAAVGSRSPPGDGKWGHADLAGNVAEWTADTKGAFPLPCSDCTNTSDPSQRVVRGGSFAGAANDLLVAARAVEDPVHRLATIGVRCAR